jgi:CHAT domain-containing protein
MGAGVIALLLAGSAAQAGPSQEPADRAVTAADGEGPPRTLPQEAMTGAELDAAFAAAHALIVSQVPAEAEAEWRRLQAVLRATSDRPTARLGEAQRWRSAALYHGEDIDAARVEADAAISTLEAAPDATALALADALEWRARIDLHTGRLNDARARFERARALLVPTLSPTDPKLFGLDAAIASVDRRAGRYEDLVQRMRPALAAVEGVLPIADAGVMSARLQLATALAETGARTEALGQYRRAYADSRAQRGLADTYTVLAAESLGMFELAQGNEIEAAATFEQALAQRQAGVGLPFELAASWGMNGLAALALDRPEAAEAAFLRSLEGFEAAAGPQSRPVMISLRHAASAAATRGEFARAIEYRERALAAAVVLNADPLIVGQIKLGLAEDQSALKLPQATTTAQEALTALGAVRPASDFERIRAEVAKAWISARAGDVEAGVRASRASLPALEADLAARLAVSGAPAPPRDIRTAFGQVLETAYLADDMETGFRAAQTLIETDTARAAAAAGARLGSRSDALAQALRVHQDNAFRRQRLDRAYSAAIPSGDEEAIAAARAAVAEAQAAYRASGERLRRDFPEAGTLLGAEILSVAEAQGRLEPGQALILPLLTRDSLYVFALTATSASWSRTEVEPGEIAGLVSRLRPGDAPGPGLRRDGVDALTPGPHGPAFDRDAAHSLYRALFTPAIARTVRGEDTLIFATGKDFAPVSWAALITEPAGEGPTAWLIRSVAVQVAPSISALRRGEAGARTSNTLFAAGAAVFDNSGDGSTLKSLVDLPHARRELDALEVAFPASRVLRGLDATESAVRSAAMRDADVVVFATHGLMAGEVLGLAEPALAFTPPAVASADDDGLLTASEAALLDLDADWVVLSACNTAAGDRPGAGGFTGLARAFLFAGGRNILVSHWPVRDDAAARLTVATIEASAAGQSSAQALRTAMLALMDDPAVLNGSDPEVWAPFAVVGS